MDTRKAVAACAVLGLPLLVVAGLISSRALCACITLEQSFYISVGASPRKDPNAFGEKLLKILPSGSATDHIYRILLAASKGHRFKREDAANPEAAEKSDDSTVRERYAQDIKRLERRCVSMPGELKCRFVLEKNWFNFNEIGVHLSFALDKANRLKDVRVSPYSVWGSGST